MSASHYTKFHSGRMGQHLYPSEFLIRTMLGKYPCLDFEPQYAGRRLLDLGFGDGRNFPLFAQLGLDIYGVEPDVEVCRMVTERARCHNLPCTLSAGSNSCIPHQDRFFDFVVASHSMYYVDTGGSFQDNLKECARVTKDGGWLIATLPDVDNYILKNAERQNGGHFLITSDPYGLRNGTLFRAFASREEIVREFAPSFERCSLATFADDWYGVRVSGFVLVAQRSARQSRDSNS